MDFSIYYSLSVFTEKYQTLTLWINRHPTYRYLRRLETKNWSPRWLFMRWEYLLIYHEILFPTPGSMLVGWLKMLQAIFTYNSIKSFLLFILILIIGIVLKNSKALFRPVTQITLNWIYNKRFFGGCNTITFFFLICFFAT